MKKLIVFSIVVITVCCCLLSFVMGALLFLEEDTSAVCTSVCVSYEKNNSREDAPSPTVTDPYEEPVERNETYIVNKNTKKFHDPDCFDIDLMSPYHRETYCGTREELIGKGYSPCKHCCP